MICLPVEAKKGMWFEDLKNVNDGKMMDSLPLPFNFFRSKKSRKYEFIVKWVETEKEI